MPQKETDLFGDEYDPAEKKRTAPGYYQQRKRQINYRWSPDPDRACRKCKSKIAKRHARIYYKCAHIGDTKSVATDIRLKDTCDLFEHEPSKRKF